MRRSGVWMFVLCGLTLLAHAFADTLTHSPSNIHLHTSTTDPVSVSFTCNPTASAPSTSLTFTFTGVDASRCDALLLEIVLNSTSRQPLLVSLIEIDKGQDSIVNVLGDLLPNSVYWARGRCHNSSAPSIVQGWMVDPAAHATKCATLPTKLGSAFNVRRLGELSSTNIGIQWTWPRDVHNAIATVRFRKQRIFKDGAALDHEFSTGPLCTQSGETGSEIITNLAPAETYEIFIDMHVENENDKHSIASDVILLRTKNENTDFITMYRVSEYINEVDFLDNHNSADFDGQVAFLTSTNDNLFFQLATWPITEYCVEYMLPPPDPRTATNMGFADYASCNGPEAKPRNDPHDPICICDVYADRMIALQTEDQMNDECGKVVWYPDGTHTNPDCYCAQYPGGNRSKWTPSLTSDLYVGRMPTWLPYFYYQIPLQRYNRTKFGENFSTPKKGKCGSRESIGETNCTWKHNPVSRVIYGDRLLKLGWNNTAVDHWPLHRYGPNTTQQILDNRPIFEKAWDSLSTAITPRCCGC